MGKVLIGLVIGLIITGCRIRERLQIVQNFRYLDIYQSQLAELRNNTRSFWMPDIRFFLFGMGNRKKMVRGGPAGKGTVQGAPAGQGHNPLQFN